MSAHTFLRVYKYDECSEIMPTMRARTHTHTRSLSLSLSHTHTRTHRLQVFVDRPVAQAMAYVLAFLGISAGILSTSITLYGFAHSAEGPNQC